jgi:voltage-gated potassium channel
MSYGELSSVQKYLNRLFYGRSASTTIVHDVLLGANIFIILLSLAALVSIVEGSYVRYIEFGFGVFFATEYALRFWVSRHKREFVFRLVNVLDVLVIGSLFLTVFAPNLAFLRVLRALQMLRAYKFFGKRFDHHNEFVYRNFEIVTSTVNILVFLLIMSSVVYIHQVNINPHINSYIDALYFTVAAVTTTGFGDITVVTPMGKIIAIFIMILGVTLFFRLIKSIFVPRQLYSVCSGCGHDKHPLDAHYCGHCGHKVKNKYFAQQAQKHKNDF